MPGIDIVIDSEPDVCFDPDHAPEAEQDEEFWDDQLIVTGVPTRAEEELDEMGDKEEAIRRRWGLILDYFFEHSISSKWFI